MKHFSIDEQREIESNKIVIDNNPDVRYMKALVAYKKELRKIDEEEKEYKRMISESAPGFVFKNRENSTCIKLDNNSFIPIRFLDCRPEESGVIYCIEFEYDLKAYIGMSKRKIVNAISNLVTKMYKERDTYCNIIQAFEKSKYISVSRIIGNSDCDYCDISSLVNSYIEENCTMEPYGYNVKPKNKGARRKKVLQIDLQTNEIIKVWSSASEAALMLCVSQGNISSCCRGILQQAYGFNWKFEENYGIE